MYKYTLTDLKSIYDGDADIFDEKIMYQDYLGFDIVDYMSTFYRNGAGSLQEYDEEMLFTLFNNYIIPSTSSNGIFITKKSLIEEYNKVGQSAWLEEIKKSDEIQPVLDRIIFFLNSTYERYYKLITLYEEQKDKLLEGLKIKTENRSSDTPQTATNGDIDSTWISYYNRVDQTTDDLSVANKLNSLFNIIRQYYNDWAYDYFKIVLGGIK